MSATVPAKKRSSLRESSSYISECASRPLSGLSFNGIGPAFRAPSSDEGRHVGKNHASSDESKCSASTRLRSDSAGATPPRLYGMEEEHSQGCYGRICGFLSQPHNIFAVIPVALISYILMQDSPLGEVTRLGVVAKNYTAFVVQNPGSVFIQLLRELRLDRFVYTALVSWVITNITTRSMSAGELSRQYEERVSLQVNFITKDPRTGRFELDWVTVSEEPLVGSKVFRDMLARARKRPPAFPDDCPTLCPLNVRGLLPNKTADLLMWQMLKGYASTKLISNLGIMHTISGLPVKVTDVIIVLTFERDETVGRNVGGRKMRLLAISCSDLEFVYENALRKMDGKPPCLSTKTGSRWSKMRLQQLEELATHVHSQPLSDHSFDLTRCFGVIRLYTPVNGKESGVVQGTSRREALSFQLAES